jgi:hypothetical protein
MLRFLHAMISLLVTFQSAMTGSPGLSRCDRPTPLIHVGHAEVGRLVGQSLCAAEQTCQRAQRRVELTMVRLVGKTIL